MNHNLLVLNLWLEYIFLGLPATLIILKMLLKPLFNWLNDQTSKPFRELKSELETKYVTYSFFNFYDDSWNARDEHHSLKFDDHLNIIKLTEEEWMKKYPDLKEEHARLLELNKRMTTRYAKVVSKIAHFLRCLNCGDSEGWFLFCIPAWLLLFGYIVATGCSLSSYHDQKKLYDNGKYTQVADFDTTYESLPDWNKNAKVYIQFAEELNDKYFNKDGTVKKDAIGYIIPDENGNYPILDDNGNPTSKYFETINTNKLYKSFLKICQDEVEVLR